MSPRISMALWSRQPWVCSPAHKTVILNIPPPLPAALLGLSASPRGPLRLCSEPLVSRRDSCLAPQAISRPFPRRLPLPARTIRPPLQQSTSEHPQESELSFWVPGMVSSVLGAPRSPNLLRFLLGSAFVITIICRRKDYGFHQIFSGVCNPFALDFSLSCDLPPVLGKIHGSFVVTSQLVCLPGQKAHRHEPPAQPRSQP